MQFACCFQRSVCNTLSKKYMYMEKKSKLIWLQRFDVLIYSMTERRVMRCYASERNVSFARRKEIVFFQTLIQPNVFSVTLYHYWQCFFCDLTPLLAYFWNYNNDLRSKKEENEDGAESKDWKTDCEQS